MAVLYQMNWFCSQNKKNYFPKWKTDNTKAAQELSVNIAEQ